MGVIDRRIGIDAAQPRTTHTPRNAMVIARGVIGNKEGASGSDGPLSRLPKDKNVGEI